MHTKLATSIFALSLGILASSAANAADVYNQGGSTKDEPGMFAAPQTVNWTGFYIGGSLGYGNANHNLTVQEYFKGYCAGAADPTTGFDGSYGERAKTLENILASSATFSGSSCETLAKTAPSAFPAGTAATVDGDSRDLANLDGVSSSGLVGDGRVGFDLARGRFLFGIYGAYGFNDMSTDASITGLGSASIEKGEEWSLGARAGILVNPRTLAYILAAYTETEYEFGISGGGSSESKDVKFSGITVGGGVEFALTNNVFMGIEGTHTFYGEENIIDEYSKVTNVGGRLVDELDETKVMGTLKIKLNSGLPNFTD